MQPDTQSKPKSNVHLETYKEAKAAHQTASSILELLEYPAEGEGEDPIMQLMEVLVSIEQKITRIERRLGSGSPQGA